MMGSLQCRNNVPQVHKHIGRFKSTNRNTHILGHTKDSGWQWIWQWSLQAACLVCYSTAAEAQQQLALSDPTHTLPCCPVCPSLWLILLGYHFRAERTLNISKNSCCCTPLSDSTSKTSKLGTCLWEREGGREADKAWSVRTTCKKTQQHRSFVQMLKTAYS